MYFQKMRMEGCLITMNEEPHTSIKHMQPISTSHLYSDLPPEQFSSSSSSSSAQATNPFSIALSLSSRLGLSLPNPAPEVEMAPSQMQIPVAPTPEPSLPVESHSLEPKKKKYAKEAWPGKKTLPTLLV